MGETAREEVGVSYTLHDEASKGFERMAKLSEKMTEKVEKGREGVEKMGESAERLQDKLGELAVMFGVGLGLKETVEHFIDANAEAEKYERNLQSLVNASYQYGKMDAGANFARAGATAHEMFEEFEKASAQFGIKAADLAGSAEMMVPALAKTGVSSAEAAEQVIKLGIVADRTGKGVEATSQAIEAFLNFGVASKKNPVMALLGISAMPEGKFTSEDRLNALERGIKNLDVTSLKGAMTYENRMIAVQARIDAMFKAAGKPVFETASKALAKMGVYIDHNHERLEKTLALVGDKFIGGLEAGGKVLGFVADHFDGIYKTAQALVALKLGDKIFGGLSEKLQGMGGELSKIQWMAGKSMFAGEGKFGAGQGFGLLDGIFKQGGTFGKLAAASMVAEAGFMGYTIGKAIGDYLDANTKLFHPGEFQDKHQEEQDAAWKAGRAEEASRKKMMGNFFADSARLNGGTPEERMGDTIAYMKKKGLHEISVGAEGGNQVMATLANIEMFLKGRAVPKSIAAAPDVEKAKMINDFRGSTFRIEQNFAEGFDPDRVSVALISDLQTLGERSLQSKLAPLFSIPGR